MSRSRLSSVAVLDETRGRVGIPLPPVARDRAGLEESVDTTELHRVLVPWRVRIEARLSFHTADEALPTHGATLVGADDSSEPG